MSGGGAGFCILPAAFPDSVKLIRFEEVLRCKIIVFFLLLGMLFSAFNYLVLPDTKGLQKKIELAKKDLTEDSADDAEDGEDEQEDDGPDVFNMTGSGINIQLSTSQLGYFHSSALQKYPSEDINTPPPRL